MSARRLACLLLGAWLGGAILMGWVAMESFRSVDRAMKEPAALSTSQYQKLGPAAVRQLLRYQVSEQNRFLFSNWELAQIGLGVLIFGILLFGTSVGQIELALPLVMLLVVAVGHWFLTPQMVALGRVLDFLPAGAPALEESRLRALHNAYTVLEIVKVAVGIVLGSFLVWRRTRRKGAPREVDSVDDANNRHVNG